MLQSTTASTIHPTFDQPPKEAPHCTPPPPLETHIKMSMGNKFQVREAGDPAALVSILTLDFSTSLSCFSPKCALSHFHFEDKEADYIFTGNN